MLWFVTRLKEIFVRSWHFGKEPLTSHFMIRSTVLPWNAWTFSVFVLSSHPVCCLPWLQHGTVNVGWLFNYYSPLQTYHYFCLQASQFCRKTLLSFVNMFLPSCLGAMFVAIKYKAVVLLEIRNRLLFLLHEPFSLQKFSRKQSRHQIWVTVQ